MWNLKIKQMYVCSKTETDSQIEQTSGYQCGKGRKRDKMGKGMMRYNDYI